MHTTNTAQSIWFQELKFYYAFEEKEKEKK